MSPKRIASQWRGLAIVLAMLLQTSTLSSQDLKDKRIVISGKVYGFNKNKAQQTISFMTRSLVGQPEKRFTTIRADGSFYFEAYIAFPQDVILQYGSFAHLFFCPGDDLEVQINPHSKEPDGRAVTGSNFVTITGGSRSADNAHILRFIQDLEKAVDYENEQRSIKEKTPEDYKWYIIKRSAQERVMLNQFISERKTSTMFNQWATDYLQYNAWNTLLRYCWENPMLNATRAEDLDIPANYFSFLKDYDMNDRTIISAPHADFLYELYRHITKRLENNKKTSFARLARDKNITGMIGLYVDHFHQQTTGFTRDVFLARLFMDALSGHQLKEFKSTWRAELIASGYFRKMITEKSRELGTYLRNQEVKKGSNLLTIDNAIVKGLIDTLSRRYSGKVMYIDFWAPWCTPCMEAMPHSKEIQEYYAAKEIVFVFLANRSADDSWRATIANHKLGGVHINLTDDQFNVLAEKFGIPGIPHYVIVNKRGSVVNSNAPGPDKRKELIEALDPFLL